MKRFKEVSEKATVAGGESAAEIVNGSAISDPSERCVIWSPQPKVITT